MGKPRGKESMIIDLSTRRFANTADVIAETVEIVKNVLAMKPFMAGKMSIQK